MHAAGIESQTALVDAVETEQRKQRGITARRAPAGSGKHLAEAQALGQQVGDLLVAPGFQRLGGGGVVAVAVDDHGKLSI